MTAWGFTLRGEGTESLEIDIYDVIGESFWGDSVSAKKIRGVLKANKKASAIKLRVNSAGGDVIDGFAIYNLLNEHEARVEAEVDALAASMASVIIMAADEIRIASNAMVMIHNPWGWTMGESDDLRRHADLLDKMRENIAAAYVARTGQDRDEVLRMMDEETWLTADEAKKLGFVDIVKANKSKMAAQALASLDVRSLEKVPKAFRQRIELARFAVEEGVENSTAGDGHHAAEQQNQSETTMQIATILAALGVSDEAAILPAITNLKNHGTIAGRFEALTGKTGEEAIQVVEGWKADADKLKETEGKLEDLEKKAEENELDAAIAKAKAAGKCSPAQEKNLREQVKEGEITLAAAKKTLETNPVNAALVSESEEQSSTSGDANADGKLTWEGKTWDELKPAQRAAMKRKDPKTYEAMRREAGLD